MEAHARLTTTVAGGYQRAVAAKGATVTRVPTGAPPLHPALDLILQAQVFYPWVARAAVARGLDPDHPRHLRKVTETL